MSAEIIRPGFTIAELFAEWQAKWQDYRAALRANSAAEEVYFRDRASVEAATLATAAERAKDEIENETNSLEDLIIASRANSVQDVIAKLRVATAGWKPNEENNSPELDALFTVLADLERLFPGA